MSKEMTFSYPRLVLIWLALMSLLGLTLLAAYYSLGGWNTLVHFVISGIQAGLVALFYMHLIHEASTIRIISLAGLFWLAIMIALSLNDYMTRPEHGAPW